MLENQEGNPGTGKQKSRNQSVFFLKQENMYSWILIYVCLTLTLELAPMAVWTLQDGGFSDLSLILSYKINHKVYLFLLSKMFFFQVIWSAIEAVRAGSTCESRELDTASKAGCLHKWAIMPTLGPPSSEDIVRFVKKLSYIQDFQGPLLCSESQSF